MKSKHYTNDGKWLVSQNWKANSYSTSTPPFIAKRRGQGYAYLFLCVVVNTADSATLSIERFQKHSQPHLLLSLPSLEAKTNNNATQ